MLIDRARIYVKAGDGGRGSASFRREKYVPRGGPDGGDGGRGGDVVLRVKPNLTTLLPFQYNQRFLAEGGEAGMKRQKHGKSGSQLFVDVPPGTVIWDDEAGELIADLTEPDETLVVARGGRGGQGNVHFKSSTRQAPRLAELGEPGEERTLRLELRLLADVGLVGLPNAGKSTLLTAASAARPKIGDYPFTTLEPNLGVVEVGGRGGQTFVLADIPGLIEGAAEGAGLGHEFLRHVTRTKVLVHVLDASGGLEGRDPMEDFRSINAELAAYDEALATKPMLVALNKVDLTEAAERVPALRAALIAEGYVVRDVSAATGAGVPELMAAVATALREAEAAAETVEKPQERRRYTLDNVDDRAWRVVRRSAHHFAVEGTGIERFTKMTDFGNEDAVDRFQRVLASSGIEEELSRQGVAAGDVVHIADHELVWGDQEELQPAVGAEGRRRGRG
ncbi:MAG: GTPase ObgE [Chloroflexota bacterium]|nr:GTPase ObgE [Chloroflexota bacterium]